MIAKTDTQRSRDFRAKMRAEGFVLRHVWVADADWPRVKDLVEKLIAGRKK